MQVADIYVEGLKRSEELGVKNLILTLFTVNENFRSVFDAKQIIISLSVHYAFEDHNYFI
jgi:hypothetical protein